MVKSRVLRVFLLLSVSVVLPVFAQGDLPKAGHYLIVPEQSKIEIKTKTSGMFGSLGHDHLMVPKTFSAEAEVQPQEGVPATVSIRIDATSLYEAAPEFKPEEKQKIESQMHSDVLETAKYPEILFKSTKVTYTKSPEHVYDTKIEGDLTLHGVTRKITVPTRITEDGANLRASGTFEIQRPDYKIETKSAGGGTVKVGKTLIVTFNIVLKQ